LSKLLLNLYNGYPEIKGAKQVGGEWKSPLQRWQPSGPQPRPCSQQFSFVFACKETSGQPEVS